MPRQDVSGEREIRGISKLGKLLRISATEGSPSLDSSASLLRVGERINGIGPKVMKRAAAKLEIVFERHVRPDMGGLRTYWRLPGKAA
jgi:hypothetical protein